MCNFSSLTGPVPTGALVAAAHAHTLAGATRVAARTAANTGAAAATRPCPTADGTLATGYESSVSLSFSRADLLLHPIHTAPFIMQQKVYLEKQDKKKKIKTLEPCLK